MCNNGVNTAQFDQMIEMLDAHVALLRRQAHAMAHTADVGGFEECHVKLHGASDMLDEARSLLDEARAALDDGAANATSFTVKSV